MIVDQHGLRFADRPTGLDRAGVDRQRERATANETGMEMRSVSETGSAADRRGGTHSARTISGMPTVAKASSEFGEA